MSANTLTFPPFRLDPANACLWRGAKRITLPPKDFAVLHHLVTHAGQLVTHEDLLKAVWPDMIVSPKGLKAFVRRLRRVLGDKAAKPRFIETVPRRGYRFLPAVTTQPVQSSEFKVQSSQPSTPYTLHPTPYLVGRAAELAQLHDCLAKALHGARQLVFVTGEPGSGKTTLVEVFLQSLASSVQGLASGGQAENQKAKGKKQKPVLSPSATLRINSVEGVKIDDSTPNTQHPTPEVWLGWGQCIEHYGTGEPYLPVLEALERLGRTAEGEHLKRVLSQHAPTWLAQLPTLLSAAEQEALQKRVLGTTRERMLRELAQALEVLSAERTLVLVLEDLQWADVSTLDLLAVLARRREAARLLVIGTYRPVEVLGKDHPLTSLVSELRAHEQCSELALGVLSEPDVAAYLDIRFAASVLPTRLAQVLHQRTEGNPLFFTSLVQDWSTRGVLVQADGRWTWRGDLDALAMEIPDSIRHLVTRQRQRLRPAEQRVLEAASVAGLEFSTASVAAALATDIARIEGRCAGLAERQQFLRPAGIAEWPDGTVAARYGFLHALYQQLWHERVSVNQQQRWHRRIGECKEAAYGNRASEIAAELAVHFEQGRDYRRAVCYLQQAGENALRRSAHVEVISLLRKGLELLKTLPDTPERVQQEVKLQMTLGGALRATEGFASPEVAKAYARSRELCRQMGENPQIFPVLWGLSSFYVARAELQTAREIGEQLVTLAQRIQDQTLLVEASMRLGLPLYLLGELALANECLEKGLRLYEHLRDRAMTLSYGENPGVMGLCYTAPILWLLGYPVQALKKMQEGLQRARELSHPGTLAYTLYAAAGHYVLYREGNIVQEHAEALIALSREQGFRHWLARGMIYRGWALAAQGRVEEGIAQMHQGLEASQSTGAEIWRPYFLALLAELYGKRGAAETGLALLEEACSLVNETRERVVDAELYRLKGELTLQQQCKEQGSECKVPSTQHPTPSTQAEAEAEACFHKAIEIARQPQAKSLELRAVMSLARLWQRQGKHHEARNTLSEIYGWFTEGFDTADLQEAKALLESLGSSVKTSRNKSANRVVCME
jgi:predicted ATPase